MQQVPSSGDKLIFLIMKILFYGPKVGVNGEILKNSTSALRTNNIQTLNYFQDFNKNSVSVLIGHEYYKTETRYLEAIAQGGFSPDIPEINAFATKTDSKSYTSKYNVEDILESWSIAMIINTMHLLHIVLMLLLISLKKIDGVTFGQLVELGSFLERILWLIIANG